MEALDLPRINPIELNALIAGDAGIELIDLRPRAMFDAVHVAQARWIDYDNLDPAALMAGRSGEREAPLYVICQVGIRSAEVCQRLIGAGFDQVVNVEGGTRAWDKQGLPVIRGRRRVTIERQVRIAAGSLVVLGVALGLAVHPLGFGLSAFVGAGLVFAGVTDTCAMGLILARMPWNQTRRPKTA